MLYVLQVVYSHNPDQCERVTDHHVIESVGHPWFADYVPDGAQVFRAHSVEAQKLTHMPRAHRPRFRSYYAALLRHQGTPEESIRTAVLDWADPHHNHQTEAA